MISQESIRLIFETSPKVVHKRSSAIILSYRKFISGLKK
ncbi:hypothetical protein ES705_38054 [subsurface metagenome]